MHRAELERSNKLENSRVMKIQSTFTSRPVRLAMDDVLATKKVRNLFAMTVMLLVLIAAAARGQSALDGFNPNAGGQVFVVVVQPDGKILLGGDFTTLSPDGVMVTRNHIARLNPDGTLDTAFNPNANNLVVSIAVQADGRILAGGLFTSIGGQTRGIECLQVLCIVQRSKRYHSSFSAPGKRFESAFNVQSLNAECFFNPFSATSIPAPPTPALPPDFATCLQVAASPPPRGFRRSWVRVSSPARANHRRAPAAVE
jgi:hypothetical protein